MADQTLKGKVAVIDGASRNLGSLICKTLGVEGASVVIHYNSASSQSASRRDGEGPRGISVNNGSPEPMDTPFFYPAGTPESIAYHKASSTNG